MVFTVVGVTNCIAYNCFALAVMVDIYYRSGCFFNADQTRGGLFGGGGTYESGGRCRLAVFLGTSGRLSEDANTNLPRSGP